MENLAALPAALAASVGVVAHGALGHRWMTAQLRSAGPQVTPISARLFGPRDVSGMVFGLTWHAVTVVFLASAFALYLAAFGAIESRALLRFIAVLCAGFLGVALIYTRGRVPLLAAPMPAIFFVCMSTGAIFAWVASNSV